jgi:hypothetical protein
MFGEALLIALFSAAFVPPELDYMSTEGIDLQLMMHTVHNKAPFQFLGIGLRVDKEDSYFSFTEPTIFSNAGRYLSFFGE